MEKELREMMAKMSKSKDKTEENFTRKSYFDTKITVEARAMFRFRTKMFPCKMNFSSSGRFKAEIWMCDSCQSQIDSQSHVLFCPAYTKFREGKNLGNDKDIAQYLVKVMAVREKMGFLK